MLATRYSNSLFSDSADVTAQGMLIRIYPVRAMEQPIAIQVDCQSIGRESHCSIAIDDDSVSRRHAMIEWSGNEHILTDLGSTNGTFVNERRIDSPTSLQPGDRVRFGNQIFKYLTSNGIETQYHEVVFSMMTSDALTQVYNKRYFLESFERELRQSIRSNTSIGLLIMDLDKFKSVNDTYGHLAGDAVLAEFAARVRSSLRSGELFARYGGEEFVLLCSNATLKESCNVAERIRALAASEPVTFDSNEIPMTVSIGVTSLRLPVEGEAISATMDRLLGEADMLLYRAKNQGRNRVCS